MRGGLVGVLVRFWLIAQLATTAAFVFSPPASAGSKVLVATVQDPQNDKDDDVDPTRLWELFPLNPSQSEGVNANPSPQPSTTTTPEPSGSAGRDPGTSVPRAQVDQTAEQTRTGWPPLAWGLFLMALLGLFVVAWRLIPTYPSSGQRLRTDSSIESSSEQSKGSDPKPQDRSPVLMRVELVDGRAVEGWGKVTGEGNGSVLVLDVIATYDESGATRASSVTDSFIPLAIVRRVRRTEERGKPLLDRGPRLSRNHRRRAILARTGRFHADHSTRESSLERFWIIRL
jgi:hypothetical protein